MPLVKKMNMEGGNMQATANKKIDLFSYTPKPKTTSTARNPKPTQTLTLTIEEDDGSIKTLKADVKILSKHFGLYKHTDGTLAIVHLNSGLVAIALPPATNSYSLTQLTDIINKLEQFNCWDFTTKTEWEKWKDKKSFEYRKLLDIVIEFKQEIAYV